METNNEQQEQIVRELLQQHPYKILLSFESEEYWVTLVINVYNSLRLTTDTISVAQDTGPYSFIASRNKFSLIDMTLNQATWKPYTKQLTDDLSDEEFLTEMVDALTICWLRLEYDNMI